jgi:ankyrin repeat protein
VEDYFNYMGMLAAEGTYDRLEKMLESELEPVDLLLLMACSENDAPKVEELLRAGADTNVKDLEGKSPMELCTKDEIKELLRA